MAGCNLQIYNTKGYFVAYKCGSQLNVLYLHNQYYHPLPLRTSKPETILSTDMLSIMVVSVGLKSIIVKFRLDSPNPSWGFKWDWEIVIFCKDILSP